MGFSTSSGKLFLAINETSLTAYFKHFSAVVILPSVFFVFVFFKRIITLLYNKIYLTIYCRQQLNRRIHSCIRVHSGGESDLSVNYVPHELTIDFLPFLIPPFNIFVFNFLWTESTVMNTDVDIGKENTKKKIVEVKWGSCLASSLIYSLARAITNIQDEEASGSNISFQALKIYGMFVIQLCHRTAICKIVLWH